MNVPSLSAADAEDPRTRAAEGGVSGDFKHYLGLAHAALEGASPGRRAPVAPDGASPMKPAHGGTKGHLGVGRHSGPPTGHGTVEGQAPSGVATPTSVGASARQPSSATTDAVAAGAPKDHTSPGSSSSLSGAPAAPSGEGIANPSLATSAQPQPVWDTEVGGPTAAKEPSGHAAFASHVAPASNASLSVHIAPSPVESLIADLVVESDGVVVVALEAAGTGAARDPRRLQSEVTDLRRRLEIRGATLGEVQIDGQRIALGGVTP